MQRRKLGELEVSAIGLGCATMTPFYGEPDPAAALTTLERAPEIGIDFLDSSDAYGQGRNEELIARVLKGRRDKYVIATKFGNMGRNTDGSAAGDGRPEYVRLACEASLARLGIEVIDLYYIHRVDPRVPIEETVGAMSELVREGKVRFLGISEAGAETIRRAHAVHPMSAVQIEYSLWSRDVEDEHPAALPKARYRLRRLQPAGPRLSDRHGRGAGRPRRQRCAAAHAAVRGREFAAQPRSDRGVATACGGNEGARRRSWRSPGYCRGATSSCRSPGRATCSGSRRMLRRPRSCCRWRRCAALDEIFGPDAAAGPRYPEAYARTLGI